jgi:GTP-binding protein
METALDSWNARISTGQLNTWLKRSSRRRRRRCEVASNRESYSPPGQLRAPRFVLFTTGFLEAG